MLLANRIKSVIITKRTYMGNIAVDELSLGEQKKGIGNGGYYADVIELAKNNKVIIYEVKSSLADFKSDDKWQNYLNFCNLFYFVAPYEVIEKIKSEVPSHVGLYKYHNCNIFCERVARYHNKNTNVENIKEKIETAIRYRYAKFHSKRLKKYKG